MGKEDFTTMSQEHSTTDFDMDGFLNDKFSRIKTLAFAIIAVARANDDFEDLPSVVDVWYHIEELATLILDQEREIRENFGPLGPRDAKGEIQTNPQDRLEENPIAG